MGNAMPIVANQRHPTVSAVAAEQGPFDYLLPGKKQWFSLRETGEIIGMSESFVENLFDAGKLDTVHAYNGADGQRLTKRVHRAAVIDLLAKTACYDPGAKLQLFLSRLREFTPDQLRTIVTVAQRQIAAAAAR